MFLAPKINAARGGRSKLESSVQHLQLGYYDKLGCGLNG